MKKEIFLRNIKIPDIIKIHIGTILIYPPKKLFNYEGGELYLPKENVLIEAF